MAFTDCKHGKCGNKMMFIAMMLFILFMLTNMEMSDCGLLFIFQLIYTGVASFAPATALQAGNCLLHRSL